VAAEHGRRPAARDGDREQRQGGAHGIRDRQENRVETDLTRGSDDADRGEHGACARHEHEPETRAEEHAAAELSARAAAQSCEGPPDDVANPRDEQRRRDDEEHGDRHVAQEVGGEAEQVE